MKKEKVEKRDIISNLPDHLIVHIISRLPTVEAVRTSILSPRWKYVWKGINRICLRGSNSNNPDKFANLVDHILENCSSTDFLSFELSCRDDVTLSRLNAWICRAFNKKIEQLILGVDSYLTSLPTLSELPKCVLASSSLVALKLDSFFDIQIPEPIDCFPCLKFLHLDLIFPIQCKILHQVLSSCPVLENLSLACQLDSGKVRKFDICGVPMLTKLSLRLEYQGGDDDISEYDITIDAPNLQYLTIMDDSLSHYVVKNLSCIRHVDIMYEATSLDSLKPKHVKNLLELFKGIAATQRLTLQFHSMDVLSAALNFSWPIFLNLVMLEVHLHNLTGWICFPIVLHTTPNLKVLILDLDAMNNMSYFDDDDDDDDGDGNVEPPRYPWTTPGSEPICLTEQLEIIGIRSLQGNEGELKAIEYLLKHAQVLDRMLIDFHPEPEPGLIEKVLMFPRASETCDVEFYNRVLYKAYHGNGVNRIAVWGV